MKRKILLLVVFFGLFLGSSYAQFGYKQYTLVNGVDISYKYGTATNDKGEKVPALMLKVKNSNDYAVEYSYSIDMYYEGILKQTTGKDTHCAKPHSTSMGKLNGVYYLLSDFTQEQVDKGDFEMKINDISVKKIDECTD